MHYNYCRPRQTLTKANWGIKTTARNGVRSGGSGLAGL
jgi:hypothetical protein